MEGPVTTYTLPYIEEINNSVLDYTLDYGGSLIKLMYRPKNPENDATNSLLNVAIFSNGDIDNLVDFIEKNVMVSQSQDSVQSTGVGIKKDGPRLEKLLKRKFILHNEFDCFSKAVHKIFTQLKNEDLFFEIPHAEFDLAFENAKEFVRMFMTIQKKGLMESDFMSDEMKGAEMLFQIDNDTLYNAYGREQVKAPALIVMCSSGFAIAKYCVDGKMTTCNYSSRGGRTAMGLGSLLTGAKNYEEMVSLAAKGDCRNVDIFIKHLKGGDTEDFYALFPDESVCFNFGQAYGKSISDFRREDLAAAVVSLLSNDLAQLALEEAKKQSITNVIMCGTMINHEVVRKSIATCFLQTSLALPPKEQPILRMCKLGPYLGSIGAWMYGLQTETDSTSK